MGIKEDRDALIAAAAGWEGVGKEINTAQMKLWTGDSRGSQFGWFASRADIDTEHNTFISDMIGAMASGKARMDDMAQALRDTAKDFGATDTDVKDSFHNADGTPK